MSMIGKTVSFIRAGEDTKGTILDSVMAEAQTYEGDRYIPIVVTQYLVICDGDIILIFPSDINTMIGL